ncbi:MAG: hypothetical protein ACK4E0_02385 [Chitinophagaceae bacterium]
MKLRTLAWISMILIILSACSRAMTPYEAANNPRGKKCRAIR